MQNLSVKEKQEFVIVDGVLVKYDGPDGRVSVPEGVVEIGESAFCGCGGITSVDIPASVTVIGESAFCDCTDLTRVDILEGVAAIEDFAFDRCYSLTEISIPASVRRIGTMAFCCCTSLGRVAIPDGVEAIPNSAFCDCANLTEISIPGSVRTIGICAFNGCASLGSVILPEGLTEIGDYAFADCYSLTELSVPGSVRKIGAGAFSGCSGLVQVSIPDSIRQIGNCAFKGCASLKDIIIPESAVKISERAFCDCPGLTIHAPAGSHTESYAREHGIPLEGTGMVERKPQLISFAEENADRSSRHFLTLRSALYRLPDGSLKTYEVAVRSPASGMGGNTTIPDGVAMLVFSQDGGKMLLEREFRMGVDAFVYNLPQGLVDKGETPVQAAMRELGEEAGIAAKEKAVLPVAYTAPGMSNQTEQLVIGTADPCSRVDSVPSANEVIDAVWIDKEQARQLLLQNETLLTAKTQSLLLGWICGADYLGFSQEQGAS